MSEGVQNLQQQIQQQTIQSAQYFYGESLGRLKSQLQSDRAQLESLAEQMPSEEAQAQIQELVDSYEAIESSLDQSAQDLGVEEAVDQALQQAQEAVGQAAGQAQEAAGGAAQQAQEAAGGAAQQAQDVAGGAAQQAQDMAGQAAGQAQQAAGQVTDQAGQAAQQAQDTAGQAAQQGQQAAQQAGGGQQGGGQQQPNATQAAQQKAEELNVDLSQVQGSGAEGRITVRDVISAANQ